MNAIIDLAFARELKDRIEALPGVLEAVIGGDREALLEVIVDPAVMETYGVQYSELFSLVSNNNRLVAAGAMDTGAGRLVLKVPGVIEALDALGYTLNIVVLFSLILVDGAIVVTELADRRMREGQRPVDAYASVAKRMSWPVTASTITTLAVFAPLLFWLGMVGEFMKFVPITVIIALTASLAMALMFIPVLGGTITRNRVVAEAVAEGALSQGYAQLLQRLLHYPGKTLIAALLAIIAAYAAYVQFGKGGWSFFRRWNQSSRRFRFMPVAISPCMRKMPSCVRSSSGCWICMSKPRSGCVPCMAELLLFSYGRLVDAFVRWYPGFLGENQLLR